MQPEISRRCLVCGASPRAGAHFCPQCGNSLTGQGRGADGPGADVKPEARGGAAAAEEKSSGVAGGEEVARAFEAWRGGGATAEEEARRAQPAGASEEVLSPVAALSPAPAAADEAGSAGEAPRTQRADEAPRAPVADEAARPSSDSNVETPKPRRPVMPEPLAAKSPPTVDETEAEEAGSSARLAGAVGATRRRAASVVKESIAPRVERVRDRSLVMLEEAPDDSGLRFVLLAAAMFGLFILLLVLSTVIK